MEQLNVITAIKNLMVTEEGCHKNTDTYFWKGLKIKNKIICN